jgi:PAS domain S-box-containing protein
VAGTVAGWRSLRTHERLTSALDRAHHRLEDSERHLRAVIEAAPAPMFVLDPLGRYMLVNQAFEDFLGVRREDLISQRADGDVTLSRLAYHPVRDVALWAGADQSSYMDDLVLPDGTRRQALITKVALVRPDGRPGGVIGSITDVTGLRDAEAHKG